MAEQGKALSVVDQNKKQIVGIVQTENFKKQLTAALMARMPVDYVVRSSLATINSNSSIQECTPLSIAASILLLAQAGLAPEPWKGHGYLVPRNTKVSKRGEPDRWEKQCTAIIGYRGYINLAYKSPNVEKAIAHVVHEGDIFDLDQVAGTVVHKPWIKPEAGRETRGKVLGAYALIKMKNGEPLVEWMTKEDIDAVRARSTASDSGPWKTDYTEMARKTPFRRLFKWVPDADLQKIAAMEEASEYGNMQVTIDAQTGEIVTELVENQNQAPTPIQMPQRQQSIPANTITVQQVPAEPEYIPYTDPEATDDGPPKDYGFAFDSKQDAKDNNAPVIDANTAPKEEVSRAPVNKDTIGPGRAKRIWAIIRSKKTRTDEELKEMLEVFKIARLEDYPLNRHKELETWAGA